MTKLPNKSPKPRETLSIALQMPMLLGAPSQANDPPGGFVI